MVRKTAPTATKRQCLNTLPRKRADSSSRMKMPSSRFLEPDASGQPYRHAVRQPDFGSGAVRRRCQGREVAMDATPEGASRDVRRVAAPSTIISAPPNSSERYSSGIAAPFPAYKTRLAQNLLPSSSGPAKFDQPERRSGNSCLFNRLFLKFLGYVSRNQDQSRKSRLIPYFIQTVQALCSRPAAGGGSLT